MATAGLVNHTVAGLSGGVTQQFDESAPEVQVREMINCVPSLSRGVLRRNPITDPVILQDILTNSDYFVYSYDRGTIGEQYLVLIGNGELFVFNALTKALIMNTTSAYLNIPFGVSPKDAFSVVTVVDYTFVVNKYIKVSLLATVDGTVDSHKKTGIYYIKRTSQNTVASTSEPVTVGGTTYFNGKVGNLIEGYSYLLNGTTVAGLRDTRYSTAIDRLRGDQIATYMANIKGYSYNGSFVYKLNMAVNDPWNWGDSSGNTASQGFKGVVKRADMLPDTMPTALNDTVVNVTQNTDMTEDDYWLKFDGTTWVETLKPGMQNTLAANTMPHALVRGSSGGFSFVEFTESALAGIGVTGTGAPLGWTPRIVGDEITSPVPSFVDNYITQVFFHKNRLGFISKDHIILSKTNDYGNFWNTTVRSIPDTDYIDITVATTEVSYLNYVVTTNSSLMLFSNTAQYVLHSGQNPLTPTTATLDVASKYNNSAKVVPKALGNKVFFVTESGGYSQVSIYQLTEGYVNTEALSLSQNTPSYLPKNISIMTGNSALGYLFMWSPDTPSIVYVYNFNISSNKMTQTAFHKWDFDRDVVGLNIISNTLYVTFRDTAGTHFSVGGMSLELPGDITSVTYTDSLGFTSGAYESSIAFTKWFIKDANGNGSKNGRLQLHNITYSITPRSYYNTFSVTDDGTISTEMGAWNDTLSWDDTKSWVDSIAYYTIEVANNPKVTILGNSKDTLITFKSDPINTTKGFELETINFEGYLYQPSQRI
ncbi:MAG: hypothetical protein JHC33_07685 [Ignisphaera sp.]|nr:hypothetical protein [Ignisphaera sp.]